jgi:hypothetical protein
MYKSKFHGSAERFSWFEIDGSSVPALKGAEEGTEASNTSLAADERRYAQLVYLVNGSGGGSSLSDTTETTQVAVKVATEATQVATEAIEATVASDLENQTLQTYVEENTTTGVIWVAEALPIATQLDVAWRVKRVTPGITGAGLVTTTIEWAGGSSGFLSAIDIGGANVSLNDLF